MLDSFRTVSVAVIMTVTAGTLQADVINLTDGSRLIGTLSLIDAAQATISNTLAGDLTVPRSAIVSIQTDEAVTVRLDDGNYITGRLRTPDGETTIIEVDEVGSRSLDMARFMGIYEEDPLTLQRRELALKVTGGANVGVTLTNGNTETENFHVDGQLVTRTKRNRYTVSGEYNQEESGNVLVKENWTGLVKYDHFVSDRWFWFNSATFESDEFADLELRSALAAGMGYQFYDTDYRSLSVEFGPSYIDENFETGEDNRFFGSRWAVNYDQQLWGAFTLYHYNEGLLGLEDTDDLTIRSRTGLRMNLTDHIVARIQTALDWDRSPQEGNDATDFEHTLTIGYTF